MPGRAACSATRSRDAQPSGSATPRGRSGDLLRRNRSRRPAATPPRGVRPTAGACRPPRSSHASSTMHSRASPHDRALDRLIDRGHSANDDHLRPHHAAAPQWARRLASMLRHELRVPASAAGDPRTGPKKPAKRAFINESGSGTMRPVRLWPAHGFCVQIGAVDVQCSIESQPPRTYTQ